MTQNHTPAPAAAPGEFVVSRTFAALRERVFGAWTRVEELKRWFGPKGVTIPRATNDLRPGGVFHYCMRTPDGNEMWGKWVYREIVPPSRLVFIVSFSDEHGGLTRHPYAPDWPLQTLSTVEFASDGDGTKVTVRWVALNATDEERKAFQAGFDGMQQGWGGTMDQFAEHLRSTPHA